MTGMPPQQHVQWMRAEYADRQDELLTLTAAAREAGVSKQAVSMWLTRYTDFPAVVATAGRLGKWLVEDEFRIWLAVHRERTQPPSGVERARTRVELAQARADKLAAAVEARRRELAQSRRALAVAKRELAAAEAHLRARESTAADD